MAKAAPVFEVAKSPLAMFGKGEVYRATNMMQWLADGDLPLGMVLKDGFQHWIVSDDGDSLVLRRCDKRGKLTPNSTVWPPRCENPDEIFWKVLQALSNMRDPTVREIAKAVGQKNTRGIERYLVRLQRAGMIARELKGEHTRRYTTIVTEIGREALDEMKMGDVG